MLRQVKGRLQAGFLTPMGHPLQELLPGQVKVILAGLLGELVGDPFDELPISRLYRRILNGSLIGQLGQLRDGSLALGAFSLQIKLNLQLMQAGVGFLSFRRGHRHERGHFGGNFLGLGRRFGLGRCARGIRYPLGQLLGRWAVAQKVKAVFHQHQRGAAGKERGLR